MDTILSVAALVISLATLAFIVVYGQKAAANLSNQVRSLAEQTDLLRRRLAGEVYDVAQIKGLQFFLPSKSQRPIALFDELQSEQEEIPLGKTIKIDRSRVTELNVKFWTDASERTRAIIWGFPGSYTDVEYQNRPDIIELRSPFAKEVISEFSREAFKDWDGFWHCEYSFPRFSTEESPHILSFAVQPAASGKFPLVFWISTDEAREKYTECLWVEVIQ